MISRYELVCGRMKMPGPQAAQTVRPGQALWAGEGMFSRQAVTGLLRLHLILSVVSIAIAVINRRAVSSQSWYSGIFFQRS